MTSEKDNNIKELESLKGVLNKSEQNLKVLVVTSTEELNRTNSSWDSKIKELRSEKDSSISELTSLKALYSKLEVDTKSTESDLKAEHNKSNSSWESKVNGLMGVQNRTNEELDTLKLSLTKAQEDGKSAELKLIGELSNTNSLWEAKVKALDEELRGTQDSSTSELISLKALYRKLEADTKSTEADLKEKLSKSNSSWESKIQGLSHSNSSASNQLSNANSELHTLRVRIKDANTKFFNSNMEWTKKLKNLENLHNKDRDALAQKMKTLEIERGKLNDSSSSNKELISLRAELNECKNKWENKAEELKNSQRIETKEVEVEQIDTTVKVTKIDRKSNHNVKGMRRQRKTKKNLIHEEEEVMVVKSAEKDNLQLVKGIGKVLEKVLNDLGIYRFEQIVSWTKDEIVKIDEAIAFPGRIEREEWVKQAKQLAIGEITEFSERVKKGDVPTSKDK